LIFVEKWNDSLTMKMLCSTSAKGLKACLSEVNATPQPKGVGQLLRDLKYPLKMVMRNWHLHFH